jgi:hypothetical protein
MKSLGKKQFIMLGLPKISKNVIVPIKMIIKMKIVRSIINHYTNLFVIMVDGQMNGK